MMERTSRPPRSRPEDPKMEDDEIERTVVSAMPELEAVALIPIIV